MKKLGFGCLGVVGALFALAVIGRIVNLAGSSDEATVTAPYTGNAPPIREEVRPDSVILDYRRKVMRIVTTVAASQLHGRDTLWVWAFFTNVNEEDASRSDLAIPVVPQFGADSTALIKAEGSFHWASNSEAPRDGYHARVFVSSYRGDAVTMRTHERDKNIVTMATVRTRR